MSAAALTPYDHDDLNAFATQGRTSPVMALGSSSLGSAVLRDELFEEAKLRDMLIQRRITREGLDWNALPFATQREVDSGEDAGNPPRSLLAMHATPSPTTITTTTPPFPQAPKKGSLFINTLTHRSLCPLCVSEPHPIYLDPPRLAAVRELYASSAAGGHTQASYNLGLMYYLGKGVGRDLARAVELLQAAAANGHAEASYLMGHAEAQFNLALLYLAGSGTAARDPQRAVALLGQASAQGHVEATYRLGRMLFVGEGVERDHRRAAVLLQRAADNGEEHVFAAATDIRARET